MKLSHGLLLVKEEKGFTRKRSIYGGGLGRRRRAKPETKEEGHESFRSCRFGFVQQARDI
jgi:hypothetical protein